MVLTFETLLDSPASIVVLALLGLLTARFFSRSEIFGAAPSPPGPIGLPFIGNLLQMPRDQEWHTFAAWAKQYGAITYLRLLGTSLVILNSLKTTRALMDERSGNYSHRPYAAMNVMCELDWILTYAEDEPHRVRRSLVRRYFSGTAALKHRFHQQDEARILLRNLLAKPDILVDNIKQFATSAILLGAYGFRVSEAHDPLVVKMDSTFEHFNQPPGLATLLLEMFPSLRNYPRWLPFSGFRAYADFVKNLLATVRIDPYKRSRKMIDDGTGAPSFVSTSLNDLKCDTSLTSSEAAAREELIIDCASVMYAAGTDSTVQTMGTFFATMSLNPAILKRAQAELDSVTDMERLPSFDDKDRLPYMHAVILEVLRYNTVTPLGLPHRVVKDDIYEGVLIPGGSTIVSNVWLIFHDPEIFVSPDEFNPDRFLGDTGARCREVLNIVWGFGRRTCPGRQLAEAALFIAMSSIAACFDLTPVRKDGKLPELTFSSGFIRRPSLFPINITVRSEESRELIEKWEPPRYW